MERVGPRCGIARVCVRERVRCYRTIYIINASLEERYHTDSLRAVTKVLLLLFLLLGLFLLFEADIQRVTDKRSVKQKALEPEAYNDHGMLRQYAVLGPALSYYRTRVSALRHVSCRDNLA